MKSKGLDGQKFKKTIEECLTKLQSPDETAHLSLNVLYVQERFPHHLIVGTNELSHQINYLIAPRTPVYTLEELEKFRLDLKDTIDFELRALMSKTTGTAFSQRYNIKNQKFEFRPNREEGDVEKSIFPGEITYSMEVAHACQEELRRYTTADPVLINLLKEKGYRNSENRQELYQYDRGENVKRVDRNMALTIIPIHNQELTEKMIHRTWVHSWDRRENYSIKLSTLINIDKRFETLNCD